MVFITDLMVGLLLFVAFMYDFNVNCLGLPMWQARQGINLINKSRQQAAIGFSFHCKSFSMRIP